jgi:hypothetical protein
VNFTLFFLLSFLETNPCIARVPSSYYLIYKSASFQILELGALSRLMKMVKSSSIEEAIKALYAVSALIRSNLTGQDLFYAEAGDIMLQVTYI